MYFRLKDGVLRKIMKKAWKKAGAIRKLRNATGIGLGEFYRLYNEICTLSEKKKDVLEKFLNLEIKEKDVTETLPDNWKQILGGKNCTEKKRRNGTLDNQLKEARKNIPYGKTTKAWHERMKREHPDEYHMIQYERFKKIGGYKFTTKKGEKVRNLLEKQTADILFDNNINYEYEKMVKVKNKYFFPDFIIDNKIIIECTAWRGFDKATKLKNKINILKNKYLIYVLIPKALNNYYKILNNHLILGLDDFVPLAQTFCDANKR